MDGILLVDKPSNWTSFDVVAKVRSILRQSGVDKAKVGHTGTLDPLATGLLVLLLGTATKRATELSKLDKTYQVTMELGYTSTTGDEEGRKTKISNKLPTLEEVQTTLDQFVGSIEQIPPIYSAIKVGGQRAYKLARAGKAVKIQPRSVTIYSITDVKYTYPALEFAAKVSSGTYIRTLAEDMGQKLGTGAYLTDLKRTQVGKFSLKDAIDINNISADKIYQNLVPLT